MENMSNHQKKGNVSAWAGFTEAKCPRCRRGEVFVGATYSLSSQKMNEVCPVCKLKFEREPGYFYVAMFVSYAMNVAEMISVAVAAYIFGLPLEYDYLWYYLLILIVTVVGFSPMNYRYSRMVLLYWLSPGLNYEPERWGRLKISEQVK